MSKQSHIKIIGPQLKLLCACALVVGLVMANHSNALANSDDAARRAAIATAMDEAGGRGKVLSVKASTNQAGQTIYNVRILTDGRVRTFRIPAGASR